MYLWEISEKMDGSNFYACHSEFYLVQVNTHTDFGDLMQQLDHGNLKTDEEVVHKQGSDITAQQEVQKLWRGA